LANAFGLDAIDEIQHLTLKFNQPGACLAETSIGFGTLLEAFELGRPRCNVSRSRTAAVGEDLGVMQVPLGTATVWFSAPAFEGVDRTGQERLSQEKGFLEVLDVLGDSEQLSSERSEWVGHGGTPGLRMADQ
jgi:hypothetical protein